MTSLWISTGDPADHSQPWQVALRKAPGAAVCVDEGCELSGGFAHVGDCTPCSCGKGHAIDECPENRKDQR